VPEVPEVLEVCTRWLGYALSCSRVAEFDEVDFRWHALDSNEVVEMYHRRLKGGCGMPEVAEV
jgi:hypothetical protein